MLFPKKEKENLIMTQQIHRSFLVGFYVQKEMRPYKSWFEF